MSNADAQQHRSPLPVDRRPAIAPGDRLDPAAALDLILIGARLLFVNGQTTERTVEASEQFAVALGFRATLFPRWGELMLRIQQDAGSRSEMHFARTLHRKMSSPSSGSDDLGFRW